MIAVIDYGMGNIGSIINMFHKIGVEAIATDKEQELRDAEKLVLPGVGAFDNGMQNLRKKGLDNLLVQLASEEKKPVLGICLGMQLLGRYSEEGKEKGLNLIPFENKKFNFAENTKLKIPHMGWDIVDFKKKDTILEGLEGVQRYYFVHSYHAVCDNEENCLMTCEYGYSFAAAVKNDNIYGVQFHPEKSHVFGMKLLENFARRV